MMRNLLYSVPIIVSCLIHQASAAEGIECSLEVYQYDTTHQEQVLLYADTTEFIENVPASGFLLAFSAEIGFTEIDSSRSAFTVHLVTLGPSANTYARSYTVEHGLPVWIKDIAVKGKSLYALVITPLGPVDVDTSGCAYDHRGDGTFRFDPSAYMNIYYVPNSLGDLYWNAVRDLLDRPYRVFRGSFNLNLPGKYYVYLCPCLIHSVLWDERFGMSSDPTRSTAFAVYNRLANSADPFLVIHTALLRTFGYAPPFLSEGWAGYPSFAIFDMKRFMKGDRVIPLSQMLSTLQYFQADPEVADRTAATFVKYLIDQYGLDRFKKLYVSANDLNMVDQMENVYGRSIRALDAEWREYVDTLNIPLTYYPAFAQQAEQMFDYGRMLTYAGAFVDHSSTKRDSLQALELMKRAAFFTGDYYQATSAQEALLVLDTPQARDWMALAGYKMMNGYYDEARADLLTALSLDSADQMIKLNLALNHRIMGDNEEAGKLLLDVVVNPAPRGGLSGEARVMLANLLRDSKDSVEQALAKTYYSEAVSLYEQQLQERQSSATTYLWLGMALFGLGDTDNGMVNLRKALYLETRPFYRGMINLWLGKVADVLKDRKAAQRYYQEVLVLSSAHYHQQEAKKYMETPYRQ